MVRFLPFTTCAWKDLTAHEDNHPKMVLGPRRGAVRIAEVAPSAWCAFRMYIQDPLGQAGTFVLGLRG